MERPVSGSMLAMINEDDCPGDLMRYTSGASVGKLADRFQLALWEQDWAILVADHSRLDAFLSAYDDHEFDDDDRFAMMEVIVASLDEGAQGDTDIGEPWRRAAAFLRRDWRLHAATLSYWSQGDDPDPDHQFAITPRIREVWREACAELARGRGVST
jgi:hypothetical protein